MPRDDREREDPDERYREPRWSEIQADQVEAMQPVRSPDPDLRQDSMVAFLSEQNARQSVRIVQMEGMVDDAIRLAETVLELDFSNHIHFTRAPCPHCRAKRCAESIIAWRQREGFQL